MSMFRTVETLIIAALLLWLPGYVLTRTFLKTLNRFERLLLAVLFSMGTQAIGMLLLEKNVKELTPGRIMMAVGAINVLVFGLMAFYRWWDKRRH